MSSDVLLAIGPCEVRAEEGRVLCPDNRTGQCGQDYFSRAGKSR